MRGSRLLALISVVAVTACATATRPPDRREIPAGELTTRAPAVLDENDPCAGIPPEVATPARVDPATAWSNRQACCWHGDLTVSISSSPASPMAKEVERHLLYVNSGENILAHLAWLRIDGHYALERIWARRPGAACWLSVDVGAPSAVFVLVYRAYGPGRPIPAETSTGLEEYCPAARKVARNLLRHFFPRSLGGTATDVVTGPTR